MFKFLTAQKTLWDLLASAGKRVKGTLFAPLAGVLVLPLFLTPVLAAAPIASPAGTPSGAQNPGPNVVSSIAPLGSLVSAIMQGVGEPYVLIKGGASPHTYSLKPSDAEALQAAQLVFWIGPALEPFLVDPLQALAKGAKTVELDQLPDLLRLPQREGGIFTEKNGQPAKWVAPEPFNMHLWLDPENAKVMADAIARELAAIDPANADRYRQNLEALRNRLDALERDIKAQLNPVRGKPFIVFHDAYAYFENRFGVPAVGSITISPEVIPGAARLAQLRAAILDKQALCVFAEPEFTPRQIGVLTEGTGVKTGSLDPLGANLTPGPDLYFTLLEGMAKSMVECLGGGGPSA